MTSIAPTTDDRQLEAVSDGLKVVTNVVFSASALVEAWGSDTILPVTARLTMHEADLLGQLRAAVTGSVGDYVETLALWAAQDPEALQNDADELRAVVEDHRELWAWTAENIRGITSIDGKPLKIPSVEEIEAAE